MNSEFIETLTHFFNNFPNYNEDEQKLISKAYYFGIENGIPQTRSSGESWIEHPLRVATILANLKLDSESIVVALLHGLFTPESHDEIYKKIEDEFGNSIAKLAEDTARISTVKLKNKSKKQAEVIRKMFFALTNDLRVLFIRLADRLDKMRHIEAYNPNEQKTMAQETLDIWSPLASRLGMVHIKNELEDLGLKFTNREIYSQIKKLVASKKSERAEFLVLAESMLIEAANKAGIPIQLKSRAKHFWSIYQKMKKRNVPSDELYDLLALRVICPTVSECYSILGIVHTIWKPIDGRFKDYIAMPKQNGYQSLHTTVICDFHILLEIQIRTQDMHQIAESGIASHWIYKQGPNKKISNEDLNVVTRLKEVFKDGFVENNYLSQIKKELFGNNIYVFTPKGDIIELPKGATAIDFAYNIHTSVGEKIVGAKANGNIIPLSQSLTTTQTIEVLTHPQAHPTINQYHSVKTAKARQKIRAWLKEFNPGIIFDKKQTVEQDKATPKESKKTPLGEINKQVSTKQKAAVLKIKVGDSSNFMIKFANCCTPTPPQAIIGYVSRGRGIIIHRENCTNLKKIPDIENRIIDVVWDN